MTRYERLSLLVGLFQTFAALLIPFATFWLLNPSIQELTGYRNAVVTRSAVLSESGDISVVLFEIDNPGNLPIKDAVIDLIANGSEVVLPAHCSSSSGRRNCFELDPPVSVEVEAGGDLLRIRFLHPLPPKSTQKVVMFELSSKAAGGSWGHWPFNFGLVTELGYAVHQFPSGFGGYSTGGGGGL